MDDEAFRAFERIAHDEIAEGYRDFFTAVTERAIDPLLDAAGVRADARVLDVATGPGLAAHRAAMRGARSWAWTLRREWWRSRPNDVRTSNSARRMPSVFRSVRNRSMRSSAVSGPAISRAPSVRSRSSRG